MPTGSEQTNRSVQIELSTPVHAERAETPSLMAARFGISVSAVRSAIDRGELPHFRIGTMYRVYPSKVPAFLSDRWSGRARCDRFVDAPTSGGVYFLRGVGDYVKIGYASNIARRIAELQPAVPETLLLLAYVPGAGFSVERKYHRRFHAHRALGEWFTRCPEIEAEIAHLNSITQVPA